MCTGPVTVIHPGSAPFGMGGLTRGALAGGLVGPLGMTGASTSASAGAAVLAGLVGGIVIHQGRGGGLIAIGTEEAVSLPGGGVTVPALQAMFTIG